VTLNRNIILTATMIRNKNPYSCKNSITEKKYPYSCITATLIRNKIFTHARTAILRRDIILINA